MSDAVDDGGERAALLRLRPRVPDDVTHRSFPGETVLLNLRTGQYHGLNESGGAMLEELERATSVGDAARRLAARYDLGLEGLCEDLCLFCRDLEQRGLLELTPA